jgi:AraC family transcriptional regulator of adaptative response/methylated-DNA-[protein]-cysteine methyltransferase
MIQSASRTIESNRWDAVLARDRAASNDFVYAVQSTGIYCRPGCASRRPRRDRVAFFDTAVEAERAGFRPCQRCRPRDAAAIDPWVERIRRASIYLDNVDGHVTLAALARRLGGSPYHLQRNFKRLVGITPREYSDARRLDRVKRELREQKSVTAATFEAGFGSSSRLYERAAPKLGMTPSTYRRGAVDVSIRFTTVVSPIGRLLVAATDRGVCAVSLGRSDRELRDALRLEYPHAIISRDRQSLAEWTRTILEHLAGRMPRLDLPLDIRATAFQWQVWQALAAIPYGSTRTYAEIARDIGRPRAVRAVARACAANPAALAIPCHRVVPSGGGVGGYRWGRTRKRALLAAERQSADLD